MNDYHKIDKNKILEAYGFGIKKKQYQIEKKETTKYISGRKSEDELFSYRYANSLTVAQCKELFDTEK